MRIVVVLPQPDGPSSTRNSRSAIVRFTSSTPTKFPHRLVTWSSANPAIMEPILHAVAAKSYQSGSLAQ
jgi:hypothetical protein